MGERTPKDPRIVDEMRDQIRQRRELEAALRDSQDRFRIQFEFAPDACYINDLQGRFIDGNRAAEELIGYSREELIGKSFLQLGLLPASQLRHAVRLLAANATGRSTGPSRLDLRHKDGHLVPVEVRTHPVKFEGRTMVLGIARDVRPGLEAQRALERSEERLRAILAASRDAIISVGEEGRPVLANPAAQRLFGLREADLRERPLASLFTEESRFALVSAVRDCLQGRGPGEGVVLTVRGLRWDGSEVPLEVSVSGGVVGDDDRFAMAVLRDVSDREAAHLAVQRSERKYRAIFETAPEVIALIDAEGRLAEVNPRVEEWLGYDPESLIGLTQAELMPMLGVSQEAAEAIFARRRAGEPLPPYKVELRAADGTHRVCRLSGALVEDDAPGGPQTVLLVTDLTDVERLEARVREAEKRESLGHLAAGIAHDLNNILQGIVGNLQLAQTRITDPYRASEKLTAIGELTDRAAQLARRMLAYTGQPPLAATRFELGRLLDEALPALTELLPGGVALHVGGGPAGAAIHADHEMILQALRELITNAGEAFQGSEGLVTVMWQETLMPPTDSAPWAEHVDLPTGEYVVLRVRDDGVGMDAQTLPRVFDPFFSTKFRGRGLGLASAQGIARSHDGDLVLTSEPGEGATAYLILPLAPPE
jgi:PAS domain S-box-containing protein